MNHTAQEGYIKLKDLTIGVQYNILGADDIESKYGKSYKLYIEGGYVILPKKYYYKVCGSPTLESYIHSGMASFTYKGIGKNQSHQIEFASATEKKSKNNSVFHTVM